MIPTMASVSDLQRRYSALLKRLQRTGQPILILKKNKPEAVIVNPDVFQKIVDKLKQYEEISALEAITVYLQEKKAGKLRKMKKIAELFD